MKIKFKTNEYLNVTATLIARGVPFPNSPKEHAGKHNKFRCTISNPDNGRRMQITWYGSEADYMNGEDELDELMAMSILGSVVLDSISYENSLTFSAFCSEFGYEEDSITALRIYKDCKSIYERWSKVSDGLTEGAINEILEY